VNDILDLSVVVPLYNEDESLPELEAWIRRVVADMGLTYEIVMVDDGSTDNSWAVVKALADTNPAVQGIKFRRNYGKSPALHTGFQACRGRVVITMDADLQDSPDEIPELYRMIREEGYDLVSGWKRRRHDPLGKTLPSRFFNAVTRYVSGIPLHDFNCGLKAYRQEVVKSIEVYGDMHRHIPLLAKWAGFRRITEKVVEHRARKYGVSKFGVSRLVTGFLDLLTLLFIGKFGKRPMHFFGGLGILIFLLGLGSSIYIGATKLWRLAKGLPTILVTDNPYFYLALTCMIIGTLLFVTGFLAELLIRNGADRNVYLIEEQTRAVGGG
jgi:glycosyltransferase involved in cell wall biosynthesis